MWGRPAVGADRLYECKYLADIDPESENRRTVPDERMLIPMTSTKLIPFVS
jgi:hypothetical protein